MIKKGGKIINLKATYQNKNVANSLQLKRVEKKVSVKKEYSQQLKKQTLRQLKERSPKNQLKLSSIGKNIVSVQSILAAVSAIDTSPNRQHIQIWQEFIKTIDSQFQILGLNIKPKTQIGHLLLSNGKFLIKIYQVMSNCPFVNCHQVAKYLYESFSEKVNIEREQFNDFFNQNISKLTSNSNNSLPFKRSILKQTSSIKKVKFPDQQIDYTIQNSYSNQKKTIKLQSMEKNRFILDYFSINKYYFLPEVQIISVVDQIQQSYAIILIKDIQTKQENLAIANIKSHQNQKVQLLQQIQKKHKKVSCFLDPEGKNLQQYFMNDLAQKADQDRYSDLRRSKRRKSLG